MFFNLFGKKEAADTNLLFIDKTYISTTAKNNALLALAKEKEEVVFVAWFAESARFYKELFVAAGINENRIKDARHLHSSMLYNNTVVFLEHHPIHSREMELVKNWQQNKIEVYNSLEDPLLKQFGSEKIISMMKMLGMKEDEAIEHALVSKSIIKAQEKIAAKVITEMTADSQEEWIKKNLQ